MKGLPPDRFPPGKLVSQYSVLMHAALVAGVDYCSALYEPDPYFECLSVS